MPPYRAVCFDLGGVLIRIHHEWRGAMLDAAIDGVGDHGPLGGFPEFDLYQRGDVSRDAYIAALSRHIGVGHDEAMRVHMAVLREEYPGVRDLVRALCSEGVVCGCLSNTNATHWETFFDGSRYAFGPLLSVRIGSHIERASKPAPAIYRAFEEAAGASSGDIVYFDDGPANVSAARERGWRAHLIDPETDTAAQMRALLMGP
jgi:putative hydrolase of the HAD superfamily